MHGHVARHDLVWFKIMANANTSDWAPWLGVVYDFRCREQWSQRANRNEPGFDVNEVSACLTLRVALCTVCRMQASKETDSRLLQQAEKELDRLEAENKRKRAEAAEKMRLEEEKERQTSGHKEGKGSKGKGGGKGHDTWSWGSGGASWSEGAEWSQDNSSKRKWEGKGSSKGGQKVQ